MSWSPTASRCAKAWSSSMPSSGSRRNLAATLPSAGTAKPRSVDPVRPEINGFPCLMCKTPIADYEDEITARLMRTFPLIKDLVPDVSWNYEVNKRILPLTPSTAEREDPQPWRCCRRTSTVLQSSGSASNASCVRTSATS